MIRHIAILLTLLLGLTLSVPAFADEVAKLNEEGIAAFQTENFLEAAQKFRAAWEIEPEPALRKNEAIAWFKAGRCKEALEAASSYVSLGIEDPKSREDAESVIANCKVEFARDAMEASDYALAEKMLDETAALQIDEVTREKVNLARLDLAKARDEAKAQKTASESEPMAGSNEMLGWVLTVSGGAIVLTALIYHIVMATSVASEHEEVGAAGQDRARFDELSSQLDTARWLVPTLYVVGASTAGVGIYFLMDSGAETSQSAGSPDLGRITPRTVTAGLRWRF